MTDTQVSEQLASPQQGVTPRRRRVGVALGVVFLVALVAAAGLYWHWRHNADYLYSANGVGMSGPLVVGGIMYVNSDIQPRTGSSGHRLIDLHTVEPRLSTNTAHATVTVLLCRVASPDLGVGMEPDTKPCATVQAFHPGTVDLGFPATELIYKITATRAGTLRISGADVSYSGADRSGTQHAGNGILVKVSNPHP